MALNVHIIVLFVFESDWKPGILNILESEQFCGSVTLDILGNKPRLGPWNVEILENQFR